MMLEITSILKRNYTEQGKKFKWSYLFYPEYKMRFAIVRGS